MSLRRLFTEHPDAVGESYFEHIGGRPQLCRPTACSRYGGAGSCCAALSVPDNR